MDAERKSARSPPSLPEIHCTLEAHPLLKHVPKRRPDVPPCRCPLSSFCPLFPIDTPGDKNAICFAERVFNSSRVLRAPGPSLDLVKPHPLAPRRFLRGRHFTITYSPRGEYTSVSRPPWLNQHKTHYQISPSPLSPSILASGFLFQGRCGDAVVR